MTLIIAIKDEDQNIHLASDRAIAGPTGVQEKLSRRKYWRYGPYYVSVAGSYSISQAIQYHTSPISYYYSGDDDLYELFVRFEIPKWSETIDNLKLHNENGDKNNFLSIVIYPGHIMSIDSYLSVSETEEDFVAMGTGDILAKGIWNVLNDILPEGFPIKNKLDIVYSNVSKLDLYVGEYYDYEFIKYDK